MTARAWPLDAASGSPQYTGRYLRQTTVAPFLLGATAARPLGARSGVRPGTSPTTVTATSTLWTVNPFAGVIDAETANEAGPYGFSFDAAVTGSVNAASTSYARIDLISVQINDNAEDGSALENVTIVYTPGTAAAPALPATPVRSMVIAQINVPISGGGAPTVTWVAPYLTAAGGIIPVRNVTERNATATALGGSTEVPLRIYQADTRTDWLYDGTTWSQVNPAAWVDVVRNNTFSATATTTGAVLPGCTTTVTVPVGRVLEVDFQAPNVNPATGSGASLWLNLNGAVAAGARISTSTGVGLITPVHLTDSVAGTGGAIDITANAIAHSGTATVSYDVTSNAPVIFRYRII